MPSCSSENLVLLSSFKVDLYSKSEESLCYKAQFNMSVMSNQCHEKKYCCLELHLKNFSAFPEGGLRICPIRVKCISGCDLEWWLCPGARFLNKPHGLTLQSVDSFSATQGIPIVFLWKILRCRRYMACCISIRISTTFWMSSVTLSQYSDSTLHIPRKYVKECLHLLCISSMYLRGGDYFTGNGGGLCII